MLRTLRSPTARRARGDGHARTQGGAGASPPRRSPGWTRRCRGSRDAAREAVVGRAGRAGRRRQLRRVVPRIPRPVTTSPPTCSAPPRASWPGRSRCSRPSSWCASRSESSRTTRATLAARGDEDGCARRCCATPARSRSPPPRSTPRPPRPAARGTPGSRRSSSTRCCAARPTRRCGPAPAALGWGSHTAVVVARRHTPATARPEARSTRSGGRARPRRLDVLAGVAGDRLVASSASTATRCRPRTCSPGSSRRARSWSARRCADLAGAPRSAPRPRSPACAPPRLAGAPRPVAADDLLPERALAGDARGPRAARSRTSTGRSRRRRRRWSRRCGVPRAGGSLEATARALFVHPNTVRYRLRRVAEVTGLRPDRTARPFTLRSRWRSAGCEPGGNADAVFVGTLQSRGRRSSSRRHHRRALGRTRLWDACSPSSAPGQGAQTPGFLAPWLELPEPSPNGCGWLPPCAGLDLVHYGTEADADDDPRHRGRAAAARRGRAARALSIFPHPADAFDAVGAVAGHSVGELTAAAAAPA